VADFPSVALVAALEEAAGTKQEEEVRPRTEEEEARRPQVEAEVEAIHQQLHLFAYYLAPLDSEEVSGSIQRTAGQTTFFLSFFFCFFFLIPPQIGPKKRRKREEVQVSFKNFFASARFNLPLIGSGILLVSYFFVEKGPVIFHQHGQQLDKRKSIHGWMIDRDL
jgi:hypothetical protein